MNASMNKFFEVKKKLPRKLPSVNITFESGPNQNIMSVSLLSGLGLALSLTWVKV